jgi:hypothetical protein
MKSLPMGSSRWTYWIGIVALMCTFHRVDALEPAVLTPTGGNGQIAAFNQAFPLPLSVRVTDAGGAAVAGTAVSFVVPRCEGGEICLEPSAYPHFAGPTSSVTVTTDANGEAQSPALIAGNVPSYMSVDASIERASGTPGVQASFVVRQAESLDAVPITSGFSGAWYDPTQSGHGLLVEVLPDNRLLAYWFAFTPGGAQQAWFGGVGTIVGNQAIVSADRGQGGDWVPAFNPATYTLSPWGTLTFTFSDCNHGRVDYFNSAEWGTYYMDLTRLTQLAGLSCP